ncbi:MULTISPECIES: hypothetical protein [unclassified Variovorax]|uniref:hypothetical protein n=1 Tax=unclassified Variovorax TaxID=663243 RepID=UPI003F4570E4
MDPTTTQSEIAMPPLKTLLRTAGQVLRIDAITDGDKLWLTDVASTESRTCRWPALRVAMGNGIILLAEEDAVEAAQLTPVHLRSDEQALIEGIPVPFRTEKAVGIMLSKRKWLKALERHGVATFNPTPRLRAVIKDVEHELQEECPFGVDTLYQAARAVRRNEGNHRSLLPQFHLRGGPGGRRLHPEVERIIDKALEQAADPSSGMLRAVKVHNAVNSMIQLHNGVIAIVERPDYVMTVPQTPDAETQKRALDVPSLPTVTRRFNDRFTPYAICVRNEGKKRADQKFREHGARIRVDQALDIVHYDDTDTAVFLIDPKTGLPWGRCWLTAGVDEHTSAVLGCSMSERPRSSESAFEAVVHGIYPKDPRSPDFSLCRGKWEWYGQHGIVNLDNASYNATLQLQASVLEFDSEIAFSRPHHPTDKPDIEHFNHRLKAEFIQDLPGWVGPKEDRELLDVGLGSAVMPIDLFRKRLFAWIVDEYSNKPCGWQGKTPREAWREQFRDTTPLLPRRSPSQELMGTIFQPLTFRDSGGLLRMRLRYQSPQLEELRKRLGARATVWTRYMPSDLSYVYVLDPLSKNYLKVPCIEDSRYVHGLTNYQQSLILKKARLMKFRSPGLVQMYEARQVLVKDTKELLKSKKMRNRKLGYLVEKSGLESPSGDIQDAAEVRPTTPLIVNVMVTAVENMVADVDEVEFERDEEMELE